MARNKKPDLSDLHEFGSTSWVRVSRGKLEPRAEEGKFVGFDEESKGYRIYWPKGRRMTIERNVVFNRDEVLVPADIQPEGEKGDIVPNVSKNSTANPTELKDVPEPSSNPADANPDPPLPTTTSEPSQPDPPKRTAHSDGLEEPEPNTGRGFRTRKAPGYYSQLNEGAEFAMHAAGEEPRNWDDALNGPDAEKWVAAAKEELALLDSYGTWTLVKPPPDANIVGCKPVMRVKRDASGQILKFRLRFVAQGFSQTHGVDYFETFSPVCKIPTFRIVLAHAARNDWEIHQMDVKSAYLNAELEETVYMRQPPGFAVKGLEDHVCKLAKGIYGLKQAGRGWYHKMCGAFDEMGFSRCEADHGVFYRFDGTKDFQSIVAAAVDDLTITANTIATLNLVKNLLRSHFDMTDLGEIHWILGVEVIRNRTARTISLGQRAYIETITSRFGLKDAKPLSIPLEPGCVLSKEQCPSTPKEFEDMRGVPYREGNGSISWVALVTRPDICYHSSTLAQFCQNPGRPHWEEMKRVIRYLNSTKTLMLTLGGVDGEPEAFTDSDWAQQKDRHSVMGYVFRWGLGAITWSSKKQPIVALSSTEAEYIATTHAAKEAIWLRNLLGELTAPFTSPTTLHCDNQSAIALTRDSTFHSRTKHIDIRYHFIRETVDNGTISLSYCPTEDMVADILTKALPRPKFQKLAALLGLRAA